ncbi:hypothetical protein [Saccharopolyspora shandongensis]|uniref:hypothetical protein n=1 Tax=Saccharopolyspora shandongensis TaxID=418495 RepID=UPI003F4DC16E
MRIIEAFAPQRTSYYLSGMSFLELDGLLRTPAGRSQHIGEERRQDGAAEGDADPDGHFAGGIDERGSDGGAVLRQAAHHVVACHDTDHPHAHRDEDESDGDPDVAEPAECGVDGESAHDRAGAEPGCRGEADARDQRADESTAGDQDDDLGSIPMAAWAGVHPRSSWSCSVTR